MSDTNGYKYEGHWKNDLMHGYGLELFSDSHYEGYFINGLKNG